MDKFIGFLIYYEATKNSLCFGGICPDFFINFDPEFSGQFFVSPNIKLWIWKTDTDVKLRDSRIVAPHWALRSIWFLPLKNFSSGKLKGKVTLINTELIFPEFSVSYLNKLLRFQFHSFFRAMVAFWFSCQYFPIICIGCGSI